MTEELVIMRDRQAVTTSLQVAQNFEKKHQHVLRDIDALKQGVSNFGQMSPILGKTLKLNTVFYRDSMNQSYCLFLL